MEDFKWEPKITELLNSKVGKYLSNHPFITLVLLVFGLTASVPVGLFLAFSAVTLISVTAYFIFIEIFLLTVGGVILLCVLCCLAVVAFWISCVLSILYIIGSHVLNYSFIPRVPEKTISAGDMETEKDLNS
ncbi:lipid droplet assembly factor 1-A-like isoform X2 [Neoarius graeffei]|uniref:lipid droplet assembly factor 1-A-like isoform X2 n=1 Tax=Neoarius graeffei TaxID=443677 RepID=UPI00298BD830|nr:lipid droplet assembly factor 1-A-like isoform X2 [Neoarius graeffei]